MALGRVCLRCVQVAEVRRLSQFLQVLGFWDPELAVVMCDMGAHLCLHSCLQSTGSLSLQPLLDHADLGPELYAIPWLSTLFADSLDLSDALRVWDIMLCLDSRFPVFLSVSYLAQVRERAPTIALG